MIPAIPAKTTLRPRSLLVVLGGLAAAATLVVGLIPDVPFAYRSLSLHVVLETAAGFMALLAGYLVLGRFRHGRRLSDLALTSALLVFALSNLLLAAVPSGFRETPQAFSTWAPLAGRLLGAALFAFAAFAPERRVSFSSHAPRRLAALHVLVLGVVAVTVAALADYLPVGIDPALSPTAAGRPQLEAHPALHVVQVVSILLFAAAAIGFLRRAERLGDELLGWVAAAAALAATASIHYFLFPSLYSEWIYTGDLLRFAFYVLLFWGAAREIGAYWRTAAEAAVLDERRRIARDLHDGLAQELAYIRLQSRRFEGDPDLGRITAAADRAFDEARSAISTLVRPLDEPLPLALADTAQEVAERMGLRLEFDLCEHLHVPPATFEGLLRIVREAVTNAARHGHATVARIELRNGSGVRLTITDDGVGFDPDAIGRGGFGLTSMNERARALGGHLAVVSTRDAGTRVEVVLP